MTNLPSAQPLRLREKLLIHGVENLADSELLAVFINSGSGKKSCIQLAFDLLQDVGDLRAILNADQQSFKQVSGLGTVRYAQLQAAREICRRSDFINLQRPKQLRDSKQISIYLKRRLRDKNNETFVGLFLDCQNRILAYKELFTGTINTANIYPRPIVERVLKLNAAAVIFAHNHPSGLATASSQDFQVTKQLRKALELVDAKLLDHLVIGDNEVYSIMHQMRWPCN